MLDALFASALARDADYQPVAGPPVSVRVLLLRPDRTAPIFEAHALLPSLTAEVRASEVPGPAEGDVLGVDGASYRVRTAERDPERLVWRLSLEET